MLTRSIAVPRASASASAFVLVLAAFACVANENDGIFVEASASTSSSSSSSSGASGMQKLPGWLDPSLAGPASTAMPKWIDLSRKRHEEAVQKAKESYFSAGSDSASASEAAASFDLTALEFDEYTIEAHGQIPDFVDELQRDVFVTKSTTPLFTADECADVVKNAEAHFAATSDGQWTTLPSGQYDVAGFWIRDIPAVHQWFNDMVRDRLFPLLCAKFPHFVSSMEDLVVDNAYLFKYTQETGRRTDVHTDSGCLSFTIALNPNDEYQGGGTWFEGLQAKNRGENAGGSADSHSSIVEMDVGQCTVRPGGVRHCGNAVTGGTRYIIGGFCMNSKKVEKVRMLLRYGSEQVQRDSWDEAQQALEAAVALNPDFDGPYSHLADLLQKKGETSKAQKVLEHCLEHVNPNSGEVAYSLGTIYLDQGKFDEARRCMDVCLEADDCDADAMMVCAQAAARKQDDATETAWLLRVVDAPGAASKTVAKAYCNLGVLNEGTMKEVEYYRKSLQLNPDAFPPCYSLACAYASHKQWDSAVDQFRRAVDLAQDRSDDESQALQNLYRVAMAKLQAENPTGAASREEMMKTFVSVIGEENYRKLSAMRR